MFELVKALNDGAAVLKDRSSNPISLNAGCELFIAFVTLFPHDSVVCTLSFLRILPTTVRFQSFADLKTKLIRQGQQYAAEALAYRKKIAELAVGFIKDGSVASPRNIPPSNVFFKFAKDPYPFIFQSSDENVTTCTWTKTNIRSVFSVSPRTPTHFWTGSFCNGSSSSWSRVSVGALRIFC